MLFTVHRYIFRELLRVFVLAVVALTLILSLGSILQPIQQYGVGPRQVVHLMGYFLPITLTFVLPMAALFAGSLVYGRFASDNELDACRASGISLPTLVCPGLALAIMVAAANLVLSFYVMPVFVHLAEKSLKADAEQILFRNIQRRRYYKLPPDDRYLIYADHADLKNDTLYGVVVVEMRGYEIKNIISAEAARIIFNPHDKFNEVQITAIKPRRMDEGHEGEVESVVLTAELGSLLGDEIQFKKIDQMRRIERDLMLFYPIEKLALETYAQFTIELLARDIRAHITSRPKRDEAPPGAAADANGFYELLGEPNSVRFTAGQCAVRGQQVELSDDDELVVIEYDTDSRKPVHTLRCTEATLSTEGEELAPTLTMDMRNARQAESGQLKMRPIVRGLILPRAVQTIATEFKTENGLLRVEKLAGNLRGLRPSQKLASLQNKLRRKIRKTQAQIKSEIHSRLVSGIGCVPMILIGIGLGIIKKGGHLLSAFAASCVPAAVLIVCVMSGKHITENLSAQTVSGVTLMWAGLGFLSVLVVLMFGWLLRR